MPDPWQRVQALEDAASFVRPGGHVVVTRSPEENTKAAADGGWSEVLGRSAAQADSVSGCPSR
ncbi:protein of unknown function [Streptomyces murinus]